MIGRLTAGTTVIVACLMATACSQAPSGEATGAPSRVTTDTSETSIAGGLVTTRRSTTVEERTADEAPVEDVDRPQAAQPQSGLLTAGDHDDLLNPRGYARYASGFLQSAGRDLPFVDTRTRHVVRVLGAGGRPVPFADVTVSRKGDALRLTTTADGTASYYPTFDRIGDQATVTVRTGAQKASRTAGGRETVITMPGQAPSVGALDVAIVLDTTGSMGDEIEFLRAEIVSIVQRVKRDAGNVDMRIGLIAYRDEGDAYVVKPLGMTNDAGAMRQLIGRLDADGGGDTPEAMDQALQAATRLQWRPDAAKAVLLVADAPPHDDDIAAAMTAAQTLRSRGVQIVPVAASGVDDTAQYVMRTMAALTQGRYVFLTDDSGVGDAHAEPDVACYAVTRLNGLIARILTGIAQGRRIEPADSEIVRIVGGYDRGRCTDEGRTNGNQRRGAPDRDDADH